MRMHLSNLLLLLSSYQILIIRSFVPSRDRPRTSFDFAKEYQCLASFHKLIGLDQGPRYLEFKSRMLGIRSSLLENSHSIKLELC
jgi:hypothetical protein